MEAGNGSCYVRLVRTTCRTQYTGVLDTLVYMGDLVSDVAKPTYLADRYTSSCPCGMLDRESCS